MPGFSSTPDFSPQPGFHNAGGDPLASLLHWAWYGNHAGAGLGAVPGQAAHMFDPRSREGLANIASLFAGGPKGDATPQMEALGMKDMFTRYGSVVHNTGSALDRGLTHEGPVGPGGSQGAGIRGLVRRAEGPQYRADPAAVAAARHAMVERQVAQAAERQQAVRAMAARKQVDQHLGSAPMAGHAEQPPAEHDYFSAPEFDRHIDSGHANPHAALLRSILGRAFNASSAFHHPN